MGEEKDVGGESRNNVFFQWHRVALRLGQSCQVQMIVRVQNKVYDELSVLWTKGEKDGEDEKEKES
jgi:hypothetical protein